MRSREVTKELQRLRPGPLVTRRPVPAMPWAKDAACRGHELPADAWADEANPARAAAARTVCAACPVQAACLAHALANDEPWGIWGGHTTRERIALRLGVPLTPSTTTPDYPYLGAHGPRRTKPHTTIE